MGGRFLILALCVFGAYSLPAPRTVIDGVSDRINNIPSIPLEEQRSLSPRQIESFLNALNEIEGIINIHSAKSFPDTGVVNWPVVAAVAEKIESVIGGLKVRSELTPTQIEDILNQIEEIINIHLTRSISDTGVINWPVVVEVIQKVQGVLVSFKPREPLPSSQVGAILNILQQVEGIINVHSVDYAEAPRLSEGVINVPVVIDVINKIGGIVSTLSSRATIDATEADKILAILSKIEGILNIRSIQRNARPSLSTSQIENVMKLLNEIEGIVNIHSQPIYARSIASIIDVLNAIESILQIH